MILTDEATKARRDYMRQYRMANKERIAATIKNWQESNRDHMKKYKQEWLKANPNKQKEYTDRYWTKKANELNVI